MLKDTDPKVELAGIDDGNTSPHRSVDTYIGSAHSTRESSAREGNDSEFYDRETQPSQQGYDAEEF
jgi:hypothetical protein